MLPAWSEMYSVIAVNSLKPRSLYIAILVYIKTLPGHESLFLKAVK